jgi:hypothetical protein
LFQAQRSRRARDVSALACRRLKSGAPFNEPDRNSYFGGTEKGYTDYPVLAAA